MPNTHRLKGIATTLGFKNLRVEHYSEYDTDWSGEKKSAAIVDSISLRSSRYNSLSLSFEDVSFLNGGSEGIILFGCRVGPIKNFMSSRVSLGGGYLKSLISYKEFLAVAHDLDDFIGMIRR